MTAAQSKKSEESKKKKTTGTQESTASSKKTSTTKKSPEKKTASKQTAAKKKSEKKSSAKSTSSQTSKKKTTATKKSSPKKSSTSSKKKTSSKQKNRSKRTPSVPEFPTTTWGDNTIISFEATEYLPATELTSIAGGFVFHKDQLVLANVPGRGWEIIGGRIDVGESPEDTFRREAYQQVGATLSHVKMIGLVRIEHTGPEPPNCPYPFPVGYGVNFIGIVESLDPFIGGKDSLGRSLISPDGFKQHYYDWNEYYEAVFRYAYKEYQKLKKKLKL